MYIRHDDATNLTWNEFRNIMCSPAALRGAPYWYRVKTIRLWVFTSKIIKIKLQTLVWTTHTLGKYFHSLVVHYSIFPFLLPKLIYFTLVNILVSLCLYWFYLFTFGFLCWCFWFMLVFLSLNLWLGFRSWRKH